MAVTTYPTSLNQDTVVWIQDFASKSTGVFFRGFGLIQVLVELLIVFMLIMFISCWISSILSQSLFFLSLTKKDSEICRQRHVWWFGALCLWLKQFLKQSHNNGFKERQFLNIKDNRKNPYEEKKLILEAGIFWWRLWWPEDSPIINSSNVHCFNRKIGL